MTVQKQEASERAATSKVVKIVHLKVRGDKKPVARGRGMKGSSRSLLSHLVEMSYWTQSSLSCKPNYYHMASTVLQLQSF